MRTKIKTICDNEGFYYVVYKKQHLWDRWEIVEKCGMYDEALRIEYKLKLYNDDSSFGDVVICFVIAILLAVVIVVIGIILKHFV